MAYPEVNFDNSNPKAMLFNRAYTDKKSFDKAFKTIIWVSYRKGFHPLIRGAKAKITMDSNFLEDEEPNEL